MAEIAEELCITQRYLRALEQDDLSKLPGTFFYKSFVKQYAAILGVPMSKLQSGIEALVLAQEPIVAAPIEVPLPVLEVPSGPAVRTLDPLVEASNRYFSNRKIGVPVAALAAMLLACSGFYSWWNQPPARQRASKRTQTASVIHSSILHGTMPGGVEVSATSDPDDANHVVLNVSATEATWLSITTSEGQKLFSGILQPSQTKTLTTAEAAQMKVGNAGGIDVRLNGKEIGPLGERGQVRTVKFIAPDKYEIVEPAPVLPADSTL